MIPSLARPFALVAALLATSTAAFAHGAWIAERWGDLAVIYGHGAGDDPYDPAKVTEVVALGQDGKPVAVEIKPMGNHAILSAASEPAVIGLVFDNGFWSQGADGKWVNRPRHEVPGAKSSGHYIKNNISLIHAEGPLPVLPKQTLQIVPLSNPKELKAGDTFKVKVLFEGAPLPDVEVMIDYVNAPSLKSVKTDAHGEVEIELRNDGLNVLAVDRSVVLGDDPAADEIGYTATLSFVAADHVDE
ncbi:DUF4198 domain-containing protein [Mesorhizobium cantuariense]|uniref:DUF4198 domain-containing protein n=1 Tax=Mesorhizobium cantuariense TaxID=1300275 RepID=A0ABV7MMK9_9HYPH